MRNYSSNICNINNDMVKNLKVENDVLVRRMTKSNYSPPKIFTNVDHLGWIQDANNLPIIDHI